MRCSAIKKTDVANGEGVRVSLFVSGCRRHCKGCFNPETWSFTAGTPFSDETEAALIEALRPGYINGLTLLGGEPFEPENQPPLLRLAERVRAELPDKTIWAFTGCTLETELLRHGSPYRTDVTDRLLSQIDVLVDGPFIEEQRNLSLRFRGSENQRLLDLSATLASGKPVFWDGRRPLQQAAAQPAPRFPNER